MSDNLCAQEVNVFGNGQMFGDDWNIQLEVSTAWTVYKRGQGLNVAYARTNRNGKTKSFLRTRAHV